MPVPPGTPRAAAAAPHRRRPTAPPRPPAGLTSASPASRWWTPARRAPRPAWTAVRHPGSQPPGAAESSRPRNCRDLGVTICRCGRFAHTACTRDRPADADGDGAAGAARRADSPARHVTGPSLSRSCSLAQGAAPVPQACRRHTPICWHPGVHGPPHTLVQSGGHWPLRRRCTAESVSYDAPDSGSGRTRCGRRATAELLSSLRHAPSLSTSVNEGVLKRLC